MSNSDPHSNCLRHQDLQVAEDKRYEVEQQMYQLEEELSIVRDEKQALDEVVSYTIWSLLLIRDPIVHTLSSSNYRMF